MTEIWEACERAHAEVAAMVRHILDESSNPKDVIGIEIQDSRIHVMKQVAAEKVKDPALRHKQWFNDYTKMGWVYGDRFDADKKIHPNLLPWNELPKEVKIKADIFTVFAGLADKLSTLAEAKKTS